MPRLLFIALLLSVAACTYVQKVQDGETAYDRKQYAVAIDLLKKEFKRAKARTEKGEIAYKIARSYTEMHQDGNAVDWYLNAYNNAYGVDALKGYAYALKTAGQYEEAAAAFKNLGIEIGSPYEYRREIQSCQLAQEWLEEEDQNGYTISPLPFNTQRAEYAPTPAKNGDLIFTSDRSSAAGDEVYNWTGRSFSDLFILPAGEDQVRSFDAELNTPSNEGTVTFNEDYSEIIFTRCYDGQEYADQYCKLVQSNFVDGAWTVPEPLNFIEQQVNYGHPSLSKDGNTLYFASDHPEGWGGYDIYRTERTTEGWEAPRLMSRIINSEGNEVYPFIQADTLYFSSDHHPGMGGLDIFKTYQFSNGKWAPLVNMKPPLNSSADDFSFVIREDLPDRKPEILFEGYFSSNRAGGSGEDDIYKVEKRYVAPPVVPDTVEKEPIVYKMNLVGYVLEKIYEDPNNPNSKILGRRPLSDSKVDIVIPGRADRSINVGEDGRFELELDSELDYRFLASKEGYLNNSTRFSSKGISPDDTNPELTFEVEVVLDKIFANREIVLENIYYDFDKYFIRDDAKPTLNALANTLRQNPNIKIQLASHTDCKGSPRYNENLSQNRAESAVRYLIEQGIDADRLSAIGYGESKPAVDCACSRCTPEEDQANRRTTFTIVEQ